ncbi:MAG: hypothetical protein HFH38_07245 [Lachnospiraceae bacterium]|nr:hypothetical protein [Lachnospiraceae bacterium]
MYSKENLVFNFIQNIFVGLAITVTVTMMTAGFTTVMDFLVSFLKAYAINFAACLVVPIPSMVRLICGRCRFPEGSVWPQVVTAALCDFWYVTIISAVMFTWQLGFCPLAFQAWKSVYGVLLIVGFIVGFACGPLSMKAAKRLLGA